MCNIFLWYDFNNTLQDWKHKIKGILLETNRFHRACWVWGPDVWQTERKPQSAVRLHHCSKRGAVEVRLSVQQRAVSLHTEFLTSLNAGPQPADSPKWKTQTAWWAQSWLSHTSDVRHNHSWDNKWEKITKRASSDLRVQHSTLTHINTLLNGWPLLH